MKRLRWQCRRGTKELDAMLNAFLDNQYLIADATDQHLFSELLGCEDDVLIGYFFTKKWPEKEELKPLVKKIRNTFMA